MVRFDFNIFESHLINTLGRVKICQRATFTPNRTSRTFFLNWIRSGLLIVRTTTERCFIFWVVLPEWNRERGRISKREYTEGGNLMQIEYPHSIVVLMLRMWTESPFIFYLLCSAWWSKCTQHSRINFWWLFYLIKSPELYILHCIVLIEYIHPISSFIYSLTFLLYSINSDETNFIFTCFFVSKP